VEGAKHRCLEVPEFKQEAQLSPNFTPHVISPQRLTLETSDFVHGSAM